MSTDKDNTNTLVNNNTNSTSKSTNSSASTCSELVIVGTANSFTDDDNAHTHGCKVDTEQYREYRVYPFRTLPSGRIVRKGILGWMEYAGLCILLWLGYRTPWEQIYRQWVEDGLNVLRDFPTLVLIFFILLWISCASCTSFYESVIPLPELGIQLERCTTLHPPLFKRHLATLSMQKTFVRLEGISTIGIHEGLTRWSVRYYLAIISKNGKIDVAFPNSRPQHAVLEEVYHGVRETLYPD